MTAAIHTNNVGVVEQHLSRRPIDWPRMSAVSTTTAKERRITVASISRYVFRHEVPQSRRRMAQVVLIVTIVPPRLSRSDWSVGETERSLSAMTTE